MQAIADRRTPNNRLFMLSTDLQVQIFAYAGLFGDPHTPFNRGVAMDKEASKLRLLFEATRKEAIYYDKLYFIGIFSRTLWEELPTIPQMRCRWCDARVPIWDHRYPQSRNRELEPYAPVLCPAFKWKAGDAEYDSDEADMEAYNGSKCNYEYHKENEPTSDYRDYDYR